MSNHQRTTSNESNSSLNAPPLVRMSGGAFDDEKSALAALLQGMQSLQLEVSTSKESLDDLAEALQSLEGWGSGLGCKKQRKARLCRGGSNTAQSCFTLSSSRTGL